MQKFKEFIKDIHLKYSVNEYFIKRNYLQLEKTFNELSNINILNLMKIFILDIVYVDYFKNKKEFIEKDFMEFIALFEGKTLKEYLISRNKIRGIYFIHKLSEKAQYVKFINVNILSAKQLTSKKISKNIFTDLVCNFTEKNQIKNYLNLNDNLQLEEVIIKNFNISVCQIQYIEENKKEYIIFLKKFNNTSFTIKEWQDILAFLIKIDKRILPENIKTNYLNNSVKIAK